MRPLRIEMTGFSAFRERTEIDLTDVELVALVGATGSGKSTIIDAITFALYGSVARYEDNRSVEPVINQTSSQARVALTFELNGEEHVAVRVVRRTAKGATTKEARLECGQEILAADARSMTRAVEELLGLDMDQFNRTVVLPQGRFADFLHDDPAKRQATLRQLLGLDIYQRIGKLARAKASELQLTADLLRSDLSAGSEQFTAANRVGLVERVRQIDAARDLFGTRRSAVDELSGRRPSVQQAAEKAGADLALLDGVGAPPGVVELDASLERAAQRERRADEACAAARQARLAARDGVDSGPDGAAIALHLQRHVAVAQLDEQLAALAERIAVLAADASSAADEAKSVGATQQRLDNAADHARRAADEARARAADVPVAQIDVWLGWHAAHAEHEERFASASAAAAEAAKPVAPAERAVADCEAALEDLERRRRVVRDRVGIAAYANRLVVGEDCPLCLQRVDDLPAHHLDDELIEAERLHGLGVETLERARLELDRLRAASVRAGAAARAARDNLEDSARKVDQIPPVEDLRDQLADAECRAADVARTTAEARAAADAAGAHRDDPANRGRLARAQELATALARAEGERTSTVARRETLHRELADAPSRSDCERLAQRASDLAEALRLAEESERTAADERDGATRELAEVRVHLDEAWKRLAEQRDSVAGLGAPPVAGTSIADDWARLLHWIGEQRSAIAARHDAATGELGRIDAEIDRVTNAERDRLQSLLGDDLSDRPFGQFGELLAARSASAQAALEAFDAEVTKLEELRARIADVTEQQAVATKLGHLLRSDGFEGWLMQSALEDLAERATVRLFEMSGAQYSLVLEDRSFSVRDHANADELRSARTLSGGETFLASLSLALALAESTAELAPDGAPQIESIFLDEGFGTLDPGTLDIVASGIEELGASGRMVGIVTHIRELADRMPVRLEVTKIGGSSTVERVEV